MLLQNELELARTADDVYATLIDLDGVAPCIPGATLGEALPDGSRAVEIAVAFGPMRFNYQGAVKIVDTDHAAHSAVLDAEARETSGEGTASAKISFNVAAEEPTSSKVAIETDLRVTGGIAQIGRGMIEELGQELLEEFGEALEQKLTASSVPATPGAAAPVPAPRAVTPVKGHLLLLRAFRRWLRRLFHRK